jgi:hypothetical protein
MPTANECRQRAQACLLLATTAVDFYAQDALIELASDFEKMAEGLEQKFHRVDGIRACRA